MQVIKSNRLNRFSINGKGVQEELFLNNNDLNWPLDAEAILRWDSDTASGGLMHEQPSKGIDSILSFVSSVGASHRIDLFSFQKFEMHVNGCQWTSMLGCM